MTDIFDTDRTDCIEVTQYDDPETGKTVWLTAYRNDDGKVVTGRYDTFNAFIQAVLAWRAARGEAIQ